MQYKSLNFLSRSLLIWGLLVCSGFSATSLQWKKLLVDSGENPELSFQHDLKKMKEMTEPLNDKSYACQFPARYLYLKTIDKNLTFDPRLDCPKFREFFQKLNAKSVSLVFSSYFINVPASAFGHTLLKFNHDLHENQKLGDELLDYGVNFAAQLETSNALIYGIKGMLGLSLGTFSAVPYYYKVREYNDFESRDLWEYQLNMSQMGIDLMIAFAYELSLKKFPYYYFSKNCSYYMLAILEVGNPHLELISQLPFYVIPIDTVRAVTRSKDLVKKVKFRPSSYSKLKQKTKNLSLKEQKKVLTGALEPLRIENELISFPGDKNQALYLDQVVEAYDYLNGANVLKEEKVTQEKRHFLLTERSKRDFISPVDEWEKTSISPDLGHGTERLGIGVGWLSEGRSFVDLDFRFALHDLIDPQKGQLPSAEISFMHPKMRIENNHQKTKAYLEKVDFIKVSNLEPINIWSNPTSWMFDLGVYRLREKNYYGTDLAHMGLAGGWTIGDEKISYSGLLRTGLDYGAVLPGSGRIMISPEIWLKNHFNQWSHLLKLSYDQAWFMNFRYKPQHFLSFSDEWRLSLDKDFALSFQARLRENTDKELSLSLFSYF